MDDTMASNVSNGSIKSTNNMRRELKITVVGSGGVGKSCIVKTYVTNQFISHYEPTKSEEYSRNIDVDGQAYKMRLMDTSGLQKYKSLCVQDFSGTNCFIICYSIGYQNSFDLVESYWYPEVKYHCRINKAKIPIILVGTKSDLRLSDRKCISSEEGDQLRRKIKAVKYIECSAKNNENLNTIFEEAVRATNEKISKCCFLL